jgi:peptidoglycan/LPS O-acetylase OafA/YrhL
MRYRSDIDGLRALAVSSVVLFHADFPWIVNGFFGVDVFFVISGFLITNLIVEENEAGSFSLASFYERRIRRIIPAAAAVLIASSICAWFLLLPDELTEFSKSLAAAVFFSSNWYFLSDVSYFAASAAATKPLLHTWTLSIEEQFYLVYPLAMLLVTKSTRRFLLLGALCFASIWYARRININDGFDALFYNSFSRAFEPLIGCLTALIHRQFAPGRFQSSAFRFIGIVLIGFAIFEPHSMNYKRMLIPCLGAAAFLLAQPDRRDPLFRIMASLPLRAIGILSYSIYLWHWPVFVFAKILLGFLGNAETIGCILLTVALSAATFYTLEDPVRSRRVAKGRGRIFVLASVSTTAIAAFAAIGIYTSGLPGRMSPEARAIMGASGWDGVLYQCFDPPGGTAELVARAEKDNLCTIGDKNRHGVDFVLWGDSHAFAMSEAISKLATETKLKGMLALSPGCPSLADALNRDLGRTQKCGDFYKAVSKLVKLHDIHWILFIDRWSLYTKGELANPTGFLKSADDWESTLDPEAIFSKNLDRTIAEFSDRHLVFMKEPPLQRVHVTHMMAINTLMHLPLSHLERYWTTRKEHLDRQAFLERTFDNARSKFKNVAILDPLPFLCDGDRCFVTKDGLPLYWDDDHLNNLGTRLLKPMLLPVFDEIENDARNPARPN